MTQVTLSKITKSYGDHVVLDDVSLTVREGEFVSLLGPSGCGKTTLLRVIAGLQSFESGTVEFDGLDVSKTPAQKRGIGMVFQHYSLFPNMTVRKNIAFPLEAAGMNKSAINNRVDEMVELIGLEKHEHKRPKQLSGGQQQRVALARALAPEPRILLLDEPLSALDAQVRGRLRDEIRDIQRKVGITTIFVTHDQSEAFAMSDRIVLMGKGGILQYDEPSEIYANPADLDGADFIGSRNTVEVQAVDGRLTFNGLFDIPSPVPNGKWAVCSFRAETLKVSLEPVNAGHNVFRPRASVRTRTYLGATSSLDLEILGSDLRLQAVVSGSLAVRILDNTEISIWVDPSDVNVYVDGRRVDASPVPSRVERNSLMEVNA